MATKRLNSYAEYTPRKSLKSASVDAGDVPVAIAYPTNLAGTKLSSVPFAKSFPRCSIKFEDLLTFARQAELDALATLGGERNVLLTGPPGVGKSTVAWRYALLQSAIESVAWVDIGQRKHYILKDKEIITFHGLPGEARMDADVAIFDGATDDAETNRLVRHHFSNGGYSKVIVVSSVGGDYRLLPEPLEHVMSAWTLLEYMEAIEQPGFFEQVAQYLHQSGEQEARTPAQRRDLVRQKYTYAGHCARWMFDRTVEEVKLSVQRHINRISNIDSFYMLHVGELAPAFKNSLITRDPHSSDPGLVFVSDYVARALGDARPSAIGTLNSLVASFGSQAMKGQALEVDFLHAVRGNQLSGRVRYVTEPSNPPQPVPPLSDQDVNTLLDTPERVMPAAAEKAHRVFGRTLAQQHDPSFHRGSGTVEPFRRDVLNEGTDVDLVVGTCMLPDTPNQGGFDAVQLCKRLNGELYLRFVQITVQHDHPIKLNYMRTFLMDFNERRVEQNLQCVSWSYEVVMLLPMGHAMMAAPPWRWKVTGDQRTGNRSGIPQEMKCVRRVAGYRAQK